MCRHVSIYRYIDVSMSCYIYIYIYIYIHIYTTKTVISWQICSARSSQLLRSKMLVATRRPKDSTGPGNLMGQLSWAQLGEPGGATLWSLHIKNKSKNKSKNWFLLSQLQNAQKHRKSQRFIKQTYQNRLKTGILGSRIMTFGFEIRDPRLMPGGFPWDPKGSEVTHLP